MSTHDAVHTESLCHWTGLFLLRRRIRSLRFTRTHTTFCIIAIESPRHGRVIVNTPVAVLGNDTISLLGAGEEGSNLKWSKPNHYGIEIEVSDHVLDQVSYYITKTIACNLAAPNMRVERS